MSRILTLLDNAKNARVLEGLLERTQEVVHAPVEEADLAIIDYASIPAHAEFLGARKKSEDPVFFPVLLVTSRQNAAVFAGPLASLADEIVLTPVEKVELFARIDGSEGVRLFRKHRREIVAVLLDMMMPVMGGEEALQELAAISPSTPIVGSSGYSEALAMRRFGDKGLAAFLQKPYTPQALAESVKHGVERRTRASAGKRKLDSRDLSSDCYSNVIST